MAEYLYLYLVSKYLNYQVILSTHQVHLELEIHVT